MEVELPRLSYEFCTVMTSKCSALLSKSCNLFTKTLNGVAGEALLAVLVLFGVVELIKASTKIERGSVPLKDAGIEKILSKTLAMPEAISSKLVMLSRASPSK
jgi:hypothetical protein